MFPETRQEELTRVCAEARAQGLAEAVLDEFRAEWARGMRDKAKQVVMNMLRKGYPLKEIYSIVGVDANTVKKFCEEANRRLPEGLE